MQHQELIRHVFVLMLENRSFDHIFGYSSITGTDSATDAPTEVEALTHGAGTNVNPNTGGTLSTSPTAPFSLAGVASDVEHEFLDVLTQLCGPNALPHGSVVLPSGVYPQVNNSGFVADFVAKPHGSRRTARRRQGPASGHKLMRARRVTFREQNWVRSFER